MGGTQPLFDMSKAQPIQSAPLFDMSKATPLPGQQPAVSQPEPQIQPITPMTNPKLNIAASGENMPEYVGATGAAGGGLMALAAAAPAANAAIMGSISALAPAATRGVVGVTAWAAEHPIAAKMIWEGLKISMYGTAAGAGTKLAGKIIKAAPDGE